MRDDEGSVLLLVLGLSVVLFALVAVVVDVSVVALARRGVSSAADGAAVSAAQAVDTQAYAAAGAADVLPLSEAGVRQRVSTYAARAEQGQPGLTVTGRLEGPGSVVVTARREVALPFSGWFGVGRVAITAESRAQAPLS